MKTKFLVIFTTLSLITALTLLLVAYSNLKNNYKSAVQSLTVCRNVALELNAYIGTGKTNNQEYDSNSSTAVNKKECFMGGEPDVYLWYLNHPFKKIKN